MSTILQKSINYSMELFNDSLNAHQHFAFIFRRNKLISIGQNETTSTDNRGRKIAKRFGAKKHVEYPFIHAEVDAISRNWGVTCLSKKHQLVSIRLNSHRELRMSKPCNDCNLIIKSLGIRVVYFDGKNFVYE